MKQRNCRECGAAFTSRLNQVYCSRECRRARAERRVAASFSQRDRRRIFERDAWTCGICLEPVDPEVEWPDPMSAAVDHIVPISAGGLHDFANAQTSHWICNSRKGANVTYDVAAEQRNRRNRKISRGT